MEYYEDITSSGTLGLAYWPYEDCQQYDNGRHQNHGDQHPADDVHAVAWCIWNTGKVRQVCVQTLHAQLCDQENKQRLVLLKALTFWTSVGEMLDKNIYQNMGYPDRFFVRFLNS